MSNHNDYYNLLTEWQEAKAAKDAATKHEAYLRSLIVQGTFGDLLKPGAELVEGTRAHKLPDQRKVKAKFPVNRRIDSDVLEGGLAAAMAEKFNIDVYERLVRRKPELSVSEYKKHLSPEARALFDQCVTTTPGTPTIEIV